MKRPSFQMYPADVRANANLSRCSWAAKGVWFELICLFHSSNEYGILRWNLKEIKQSLGCPKSLLLELINKGVLKGADDKCAPYFYQAIHAGALGQPIELIKESVGPCWYCSRMVRDEYIRYKKGGETKFKQTKREEKLATKAGDNYSPNHSPIPPIGDWLGDGASSSTSSSTSLIPKKYKKKSPLEFPEWLPEKLLDDFRLHRKELKKPLSAEGEKRLLKTLEKLHAEGHDPVAAIDQSIERGYVGVFPVKKKLDIQNLEGSKHDAYAVEERV